MDLAVDPDDGLVVSEAGVWAAQKHLLLADYIRATYGARGKLHRAPAYLDLYCGPGRTRIEETGEIADGSPLVAWGAASEKPNPFREMFIADERLEYCDAVQKRLQARAAPAVVQHLSAVEASRWAAARLDSRSLHLAFIDPYNMRDLPWAAFEPLIEHAHIDFIVHFSLQDLTRNLDRYFAEEPSPLDHFAPGWRDAVDQRDPVQMRGRFFEHWISLFKGYKLADAVPLIVNKKRAPLYRLVLLSRHPLANKIWKSVADTKSPQLGLGL